MASSMPLMLVASIDISSSPEASTCPNSRVFGSMLLTSSSSFVSLDMITLSVANIARAPIPTPMMRNEMRKYHTLVCPRLKMALEVSTLRTKMGSP